MMQALQTYLALRRGAQAKFDAGSVREALRSAYDARAGDIAERLARGNVNIQNGDYEMASDVDLVFGPAPWRHH